MLFLPFLLRAVFTTVTVSPEENQRRLFFLLYKQPHNRAVTYAEKTWSCEKRKIKKKRQ